MKVITIVVSDWAAVRSPSVSYVIPVISPPNSVIKRSPGGRLLKRTAGWPGAGAGTGELVVSGTGIGK